MVWSNGAESLGLCSVSGGAADYFRDNVREDSSWAGRKQGSDHLRYSAEAVLLRGGFSVLVRGRDSGDVETIRDF